MLKQLIMRKFCSPQRQDFGEDGGGWETAQDQQQQQLHAACKFGGGMKNFANCRILLGFFAQPISGSNADFPHKKIVYFEMQGKNLM